MVSRCIVPLLNAIWTLYEWPASHKSSVSTAKLGITYVRDSRGYGLLLPCGFATAEIGGLGLGRGAGGDLLRTIREFRGQDCVGRVHAVRNYTLWVVSR